jgi:hypothetical protein
VTESRMTRYRRRFAEEHGAPELAAALARGEVSATAAFRAAKWLPRAEQARRMKDDLTGFSREMAALERQHVDKGRTRRELTYEEWALILAVRQQERESRE